MKKILSILICAFLLAFTFVACGSSNTSEVEIEENERFFIIDTVEFGVFNDDAYIMVDRETGVCYLYAINGYRGSMTALLNTDGKPILWEE